MKKIILLLTFCFTLGQLFAQDADKLRDEGDAALKAKNYEEALTKYSEFLKLTNYEDAARIYNAGIAANQIKNYPEAVRFFDMAIKKGENAENAYVGKVQALRELNKPEEFSAAVEVARKAYPANKNLEKLLYGYFMKLGQAKQKEGKTGDAEKYFNEVLKVSDKNYQGNALYSLGAMYYGVGAKILQVANPIAQTEPDKYKAEKGKADTNFKKAKEFLDKAMAVTPENANAKKLLDSVNTLLQ